MNNFEKIKAMNIDKPYLFNRVMEIQKDLKVAGKYIQPSGDVILKPHDGITLVNTVVKLTMNGIKYLEVEGDE